MIKVDGFQFSNWETAIKNNINLENDSVVILIIPGSRGKGPLYGALKRFLITKCPIPSQIILSGTISKGKNLRSIVNKILIQICAKVGGEPWTIDKCPCSQVPTMLCGIDNFSKQGKDEKNLLGFAATYNKTFSKYFSLSKKCKGNDVVGKCIEESMDNVIIIPKYIIY